jgi:hypothetical protein
MDLSQFIKPLYKHCDSVILDEYKIDLPRREAYCIIRDIVSLTCDSKQKDGILDYCIRKELFDWYFEDADGVPIICYIVKNGNVSLLKRVQDSIGYLDEVFDGNGNNLIIWSVLKNNDRNLGMLKYLLEHVQVKMNKFNMTPIHYIVINDMLAELQYFYYTYCMYPLDLQNNIGNTPLHEGMLFHSWNCVQFLVINKVGLFVKNNEGHDALYYCDDIHMKDKLIKLKRSSSKDK